MKKIIIKLYREDIFWNRTHIPIVWTNQLYNNNRTLTFEAIKYKEFLKSITNEIKKDIGLKKEETVEDFLKAKRIFIAAKFYLKTNITKKGEIDQRDIRDWDNLFKPLQDAFESKKKKGYIGLWDNDKAFRWGIGVIEENKYDYSRIEIVVHDLSQIQSEIESLMTPKIN